MIPYKLLKLHIKQVGDIVPQTKEEPVGNAIKGRPVYPRRPEYDLTRRTDVQPHDSMLPIPHSVAGIWFLVIDEGREFG